jgi:hypothetical protein
MQTAGRAAQTVRVSRLMFSVPFNYNRIPFKALFNFCNAVLYLDILDPERLDV